MNRTAQYVATALILSSVQGVALAQYTGAALNEHLDRWADMTGKTRVLTENEIAQGAAGYAFVMGAASMGDRVFYCIPLHDKSNLQVVAVVRGFLAANPQRWHEPPVDLIRDALGKAFPCRNER